MTLVSSGSGGYSSSMNGSSYHEHGGMDTNPANQTGDSANSILQSVKEQEAQFERLTRELEAERRSVADQLEQCHLGSQSGSVRSINSAAFDNHSYVPYVEQGADPTGDETHNDDSHLVDSCLRVLQERGIMQSEGGEVRGKSVGFDPRRDESHAYNGYSSRETTSVQSSSQNSYRQPEGGGMSRSQANYSLHSAAGDDYASYSQLKQQAEQPQRQNYDEYRDYRKPYVNDSTAQLSDGDYVDSSAAASYMNNYRDYQDHAELEVGGQGQSELNHTENGHDDGNYMYQGNGHTEDSQINGGDYIEQGSYRENIQQENYGQENFEQRGYEQNHIEQPPDYGYDYNQSSQALRVSQEFLRVSQEHLRASQNLDPNQIGRSEEELNMSRGQPRGSREHLHDGRTAIMHSKNPNYDDELYPSHANNGSEGFGSYKGNRNSGDPTQVELYGADNSGRYEAYNGDQVSYNDPLAGSHPMLADPQLLYGSQQLVDAITDTDQQWRPPDLPEVIEYLSHPNDAIKANAAAYLQHLCYGNNEIKTKTRSLRGIPALVNLLRNDIPEVHRNALGALLNLSRGYENDDNKRAMKNCGGIEALATLLGRSRDNDVRELITGIFWNMSSLGELKKPVITSALNALVQSVILPAVGLPNTQNRADNSDVVIWSTEFRNATGVLRNVSSDGPFARKQLRECDWLMEALLKVTRSVIGRAEMDNKPVENVVCTLRNLSFRLMEVDYPDYYDKKANGLQQTPKKLAPQDLSILGCFGKSKKQSAATIEYPCRTPVGHRRGEQLWQIDLVDMYLPLLSDCSNTDTLEAAVGAIQNLTACEWQPSIQFREHMRKRRGLPTVVELLGLEEADNVVCGAAIALRNLAIDKSNKTLIGKYAIEQLVSKLPPAGTTFTEHSRASEETIRAVLATLHEVFKDKDPDSGVHASTLVNDTEGLERLMTIAKSQRKYMSKTLRSAHQLLTALWRFTPLREAYKNKGYKESDFLSKTMVPKHGGNAGTMSVTSTLTRPRSEPASNTNTIARSNVAFRDDQSDERPIDVNDPYIGTYPSNGTLPIQRPLYQQQDDPHFQLPPNAYNYQTQNSYDSYNRYQTIPGDPQAPATNSYSYQPPTGSYRQGSYNQQQSYDANYPEDSTPGYQNQPLNSSHNFSQSREGLLPNSLQDYNGAEPGQQAEPLYARVEKRKPNVDPNQAFMNPNFNSTTAISMESLNRADYSLHPNSQPDNNTGVDSWV